MEIIFLPTLGYILTIPHEFTDVFNTRKEASGDAHISDVIAIGKSYKDDHGNLREPPCKVGDIILHQYTPHDTVIGTDKYTAVHFSQVLAILNAK